MMIGDSSKDATSEESSPEESSLSLGSSEGFKLVEMRVNSDSSPRIYNVTGTDIFGANKNVEISRSCRFFYFFTTDCIGCKKVIDSLERDDKVTFVTGDLKSEDRFYLDSLHEKGFNILCSSAAFKSFEVPGKSVLIEIEPMSKKIKSKRVIFDAQEFKNILSLERY